MLAHCSHVNIKVNHWSLSVAYNNMSTVALALCQVGTDSNSRTPNRKNAMSYTYASEQIIGQTGPCVKGER